MKKYYTVANEMFTDKLTPGLSPSEITKLFIVDYFEWNKFAYAESKSDTPEKEWNIGKSYDNLILKYCGLDKKYQGLSYGSNNELPADTHILEELVEGNTSIVRAKYQNSEIEFIYSKFEYHFIKKTNDSNWILEEKYYIDDDEDKHKYL